MNEDALRAHLARAVALGAVSVLDRNVRDLGVDLLAGDEYVVPPAVYFAATSPAERAVFGHARGLYCLPTVELVEWLRGFIGDRTAVEIGAGEGIIGREVGIPATDNYLQTWPEVAELYARTGQPASRYGAHVARMDANAAVAALRPDVVVGAWITHKYDPARHELGGNMFGPDLPALLEHCEHLVLICNEATHAANPLLGRPHQRVTPPWLYSRSATGAPDFIAIFTGARAP